MRKPYYQDDHATIYHGDCREILPELPAVDICFSSPPYNTLPTSGKASGIHAERKTGKNLWMEKAAAGYADTMPEAEYQNWMVGIFDIVFKKCRGLMWINHKIRYRESAAIHPARIFPWDIYAEVIWDRELSMALNCKRYAPSTEHIIGFGKPHTWNDENNKLMSVWRIPPTRQNNGHPCPFPMAIAMRIVSSSTAPGDVVLDPFLGSGTTLLAAKDLQRKGIGIEQEEKYCELAAQRLEESVSLFAAEPEQTEPEPELFT